MDAGLLSGMTGGAQRSHLRLYSRIPFEKQKIKTQQLRNIGEDRDGHATCLRYPAIKHLF